jgi:hypothetical protein
MQGGGLQEIDGHTQIAERPPPMAKVMAAIASLLRHSVIVRVVLSRQGTHGPRNTVTKQDDFEPQPTFCSLRDLVHKAFMVELDFFLSLSTFVFQSKIFVPSVVRRFEAADVLSPKAYSNILSSSLSVQKNKTSNHVGERYPPPPPPPPILHPSSLCCLFYLHPSRPYS